MRGGRLVLVCVADDPQSSDEVVRASTQHAVIEPCIGLHPWQAHEYGIRDVVNLLDRHVGSSKVKCLGEVGLDKKFRPGTFKRQLKLFELFVDYAREYDLVLNLHAADAWVEVFELIYKRGVDRAYFHWYTGSIELLHQIESVGYYIGANPAWQIQQRHRNILEEVSLENVLTESDAPYNYRGLLMTPSLVELTVKYLADIRKLSVTDVEERVYSNFRKLFSKR
ncbi:MAG: TatD family hydrolase [Desulfurococcaceae archaeon]